MHTPWVSDGSEREVLLACGVLDEAGREDSLVRLTAGTVSPIFSNSLVRLYCWNCSVSGLPTLDSSTESKVLSSVVSIFGLSVESSGGFVCVELSGRLVLWIGLGIWARNQGALDG